MQITLSRKISFLSLTLRGIARHALHTPRRAPQVTPSILLSVFHVLEYEGDPRSSTLFFFAFLFTFYLMAGLANIVLKSAKSLDIRYHLTRGDVARCYFSWLINHI